eukprot:295609_1
MAAPKPISIPTSIPNNTAKIPTPILTYTPISMPVVNSSISAILKNIYCIIFKIICAGKRRTKQVILNDIQSNKPIETGYNANHYINKPCQLDIWHLESRVRTHESQSQLHFESGD